MLLAGLALAQDPSRGSWEALHDTLLLEAADYDVEAAAQRYDQLARDLGPDDPVRSEALYWLGRALYEQGDVDDARVALRECVRSSFEKARCLKLVGQIELASNAIATVPVRWSFNDLRHGFVHPWRYATKGSIRIQQEGVTDPVLAWRTVADTRSDDQLVVGFDSPRPPPTRIRFLVRSQQLDAYLRLNVYDVFGNRYTAPPPDTVVRVPRGEMVVIDLGLDDLQGEDPGQRRFNPAQIDRLVIQDVTAYYGGGTGANELYLDDFKVE